MEVTKKEIEIKSQLKKLLPGVQIDSLRAGNVKEVNQCHYIILPENKNLRGSKYFYKEALEFVHFTNLDALKAILANKNIRLYNLYNLNDPREFSYAGDLITFNLENRDDAKKNMFLISMCRKEILTDSPQYEFNMWRLYGQNGTGVCVQLEFSMNPPENWKDYFLSATYYGNTYRKKLLEVSKLLRRYEKQKPSTTIDLSQLVTFHKSNLYRLEKEVRLLFDDRQYQKVHGATRYSDYLNRTLAPVIKPDIEKSKDKQQEIKYLELPLFHKEFDSISERIPVPKITKVILGHSFKDKFKEVSDQLKQLADTTLGYKIPIELSRLTKYYYEK
jgi:hypothetical protein